MFLNWVLGKTLESPLDCKEIKPVNPKGNQSWIFIGRTDMEAEAPILWPPDAKNWLIWKDPEKKRKRKDPDTGKDWRWDEKGTTEDEMVGWHQRPDGHESEQALGFGDGQGSLACCSPQGRKESDTTERLNWRNTRMLWIYIFSIKNSRCIIVSHNTPCLSKYMHKYGRIFIT